MSENTIEKCQVLVLPQRDVLDFIDSTLEALPSLRNEWTHTHTHTSIHGHPQRERQRQGDRETVRENPEILLYIKKCKTFTAFINTFWIVVLLPFLIF